MRLAPSSAKCPLRPLRRHQRREDYQRTPRAFSSLAHDRGAQSQRYVDTFGGLATTWTGYVLALHAVGRTAEAEDVAFAWRDRWPAMGRIFLDMAIETLTKPGNPAVDPARLKRYAAVIEEMHDAPGAAALGWSASAHGDWSEAAVWLKASTDWRAPDSPPDAKVVAGYIDALRQGGRYEEALVVATGWQDRIPALKAGMIDTAVELLGAAGDAARKSPGDASVQLPPERLAEIVALAKADPGFKGPSALGWFYYNTGQSVSALPWFKIAVRRASDMAASPATAPTGANPAATAASDPANAPNETSAAAGGNAAAGTDPTSPDDREAALGKAVEGYALALRALGRDADALTFVTAWGERLPSVGDMVGDVAAEILGRGDAKGPIDSQTLARLTAATEKVRSVPAATAFGWYDYAHRDWAGAAAWFANGVAWSPDQKGPAKIAEGYASSLHNQCRFGEAESVALARMDDDATGALRRIYVDSVSDRLARQKAGVAMSPDEADRLAAATMASGSANGAQALGWYSYRSRAVPGRAVAWFTKAVGWGATEANTFGLGLAYRRTRDTEGLARLLAAYGTRFRSLDAIQRAGLNGPDPAVPDFGNLTRGSCAPATNTQQAGAAPSRRTDVGPTDAAVLLAPVSARPAEPAAVSAPSAQAFYPVPVAASQASYAPPMAASAQATFAAPLVAPASSVAAARVAPDPSDQDVEAVTPRARLRPLTVHPRPDERRVETADDGAGSDTQRTGSTVHARSGSAAAALQAEDYVGCLTILDRRGRAMTSDDRETQGWCLLGLQRPAEAAAAFKAAEAGGKRQIASDSAFGETLSDLQNGDTEAAVDSAARTSLDGEKRRTLGVQILAQKAYDAYGAGRWDETLSLLRQRSAYATDNPRSHDAAGLGPLPSRRLRRGPARVHHGRSADLGFREPGGPRGRHPPLPTRGLTDDLRQADVRRCLRPRPRSRGLCCVAGLAGVRRPLSRRGSLSQRKRIARGCPCEPASRGRGRGGGPADRLLERGAPGDRARRSGCHGGRKQDHGRGLAADRHRRSPALRQRPQDCGAYRNRDRFRTG